MEIKGRIRIPTTDYAYLEIDFEGTEQDMIATHDRLQNLVAEKEGLGSREWAQARNNYIVKNEIDDVTLAQMSKAQRFVINEVKLAIRSANKE